MTIPSTCSTWSGTLEIGGVSMHTDSWDATDLMDLWGEADQRGSDRLIPGAAGVLPRRRRRTVSGRQIPMVFQADTFAALATAVDLFLSTVVAPTNTGDGTRAATLTMPNGDVRTADVHVTGLQLGQRGSGHGARGHVAAVRAVLVLSIPAGRFA